MKSNTVTTVTIKGTCSECNRNVTSDDARQSFIVAKTGEKLYRHTKCTIRGKCGHCQSDVTCGQARQKVGEDYWHKSCVEKVEEERKQEEKRQAEEKRKQEETEKRHEIHARDKTLCVLCEMRVTSDQETEKFKRKYTVHSECMIYRKKEEEKAEEDDTDITINVQCSHCADDTGDWEDYGYIMGKPVCQACNYKSIIVGKCGTCKHEITMQERHCPELSEDANGVAFLKETFQDNNGYHCYACVEKEKNEPGTEV